MTPQDEDLHDQLMHAFSQYFKANQQWLNKATRRAGMDTRYWLSEIRRIASERRIKIQEWRHDLDRHKAEKKKIQNQKAKGSDNTT
jgi:hypothetical protein